MKSGIITAATSALLFSGVGNAAEIKVLSTQATEQAYRELVPQFEQASGHKVTTIFTGTLDANKRLAAGETYDLVIMSSASTSISRAARSFPAAALISPNRAWRLPCAPARRSPTSARPKH